ncbi:21763_t:CDS:1, partial [Gigaspora rosea]
MKEIKSLIKFCKRKKTLNAVNIYVRRFFCGIGGYDGYLDRLSRTDELYINWNKIKKDLEGYVKLMPQD